MLRTRHLLCETAALAVRVADALCRVFPRAAQTMLGVGNDNTGADQPTLALSQLASGVLGTIARSGDYSLCCHLPHISVIAGQNREGDWMATFGVLGAPARRSVGRALFATARLMRAFAIVVLAYCVSS